MRHQQSTRLFPFAVFLSVVLAAGLTSQGSAQSTAAPARGSGVVTANTPMGPLPGASGNQAIVPVGCPSCGGSSLLDGPVHGVVDGGCDNCPTCGCGNGCCYPGRKPCECDCGDSFGGRLLAGLYHAICCPDPCYEPYWNPTANAALFVDGARPVTQLAIRGDFGWNLQFPDRSNYFWARESGFQNAAGVQSTGKGPQRPNGLANFGESAVDYKQGVLHTEGALDRIGLFIELAYENVQPTTYQSASGLGDMVVGTKTLLLDSELIQFAMQLKTFIPTGAFTRGLGVGHVSLEPAFLAAVKVTPKCFVQGETAYWFPIGGDQGVQGPVFHYGLSVNQVLCECGCEKGIQVIGCLEMTGYEFTSGSFTDPSTGVLVSSTAAGNILNVGPTVRLSVCNTVDFGLGGQFCLTSDHLAQQLLRAEFRWRF